MFFLYEFVDTFRRGVILFGIEPVQYSAKNNLLRNRTRMMHKRVMIRRRHLTSQAHPCEGEFSGVTCEALAGACPRCIVRVRFPVGSVPAVYCAGSIPVGSVPAVYCAGSIPCGERARGVSCGFDSLWGADPTVLSLAVCLAVFYAVDCITFFDGLKTVCDDDESLAAME